MLLVLFAEKWCWIKEHNSSLGILHFPYPWLIIKDFSSISFPALSKLFVLNNFCLESVLSSVSPMGVPGLPLQPGNAVSAACSKANKSACTRKSGRKVSPLKYHSPLGPKFRNASVWLAAIYQFPNEITTQLDTVQSYQKMWKTWG